jgi:hypothetical protein
MVYEDLSQCWRSGSELEKIAEDPDYEDVTTRLGL